jgi:hypothetical protein
MSDRKHEKLHISFLEGISPGELSFPRKYTLTHSDFTGEMFLSIDGKYNARQYSGFYSRLMRDEVLAELKKDPEGIALHVYGHVSGGCAFGGARWRNDLLHYHMPSVIKVLRYGERQMISMNPEVDRAHVWVHFSSHRARYNRVEDWGVFSKYQ